jgi:hypothetical protein
LETTRTADTGTERGHKPRTRPEFDIVAMAVVLVGASVALYHATPLRGE